MVRKNAFWGFMMTTAIGVALTSCHDDTPGAQGREGYGGIDPRVELNASVVSTQKSVSRTTEVTVNDLSLKLTKSDGTLTKSWTSLSEFDTETAYPIGDYTMEASYGSIDDEGFGKPAYYGSTSFSVLEKKTTPVTLTAQLANSMMTIEYTDDFKHYMTSWNADIHSSGGGFLYYGPDETQPIYVKPGSVNIDVTFTKPNGVGATLRVATVTAKPRYHYHIIVGLSTQTGDATLTVTFDENLDKEEISIDLSDEILNAPAPTFTGNGIEAGANVEYRECTEPAKATLDVVARGELATVTLVTHSKTLNTQGWPNEVDLTTASEDIRSRLASLGFESHGIYGEKGRLAVLDFTKVPTYFREIDGNEPTQFDVQAVDRYGKVSEVYTFTMTMSPLIIKLSNPSALPIAAKNLEVDLDFNGNDARTDVTVQILNTRGTWEAADVKNIEKTADEKYRVSLKVPATTLPVTLRAATKGKNSAQLVVNRTGVPQFDVNVYENDIWATRADITLTSDEADANVLASGAVVYIATDDVNYTTATITAVNDNVISIGGLTPATTYNVKVAFSGLESLASQPVTFTTESPLELPNGGFENLTDSYSANNRDQGGKWSISAGINYQSTNTFAIREANGWATVNAKTMSGSNQNTWFAQPAVFNTGLTWSSTVPKIKVVGTGGGTATPASFSGFSVHGGSNAMVVRNVAWDGAGSTPGVWKKEFANQSEYYNHTVPTIANISVGRMFLGSYGYANGTETYNEGIGFTSRPTSLKGWYTFAPDGNDTDDTGMVTVTVMNGNTVIGTGTAALKEASMFTQFTVPIKYIANAPKATSICVMVESSTHGARNNLEAETNAVKVSTYLSRYEAYQHGATLVVDDFSFVY